MKAGVTSGMEVVSAIEAAAAQRGVDIVTFIRPITGNRGAQAWLGEVRRAHRPKAATIERIRELLAGKVPAAPRPYVRQAGAGRAETPITPLSEPVDRDPCFRCGVRRDIGCRHSRGGARDGL